MHAICWPGLLIQLVMRLLAEQTQDADGWCEELDRQSRSSGFAWLYTGIFWLCFILVDKITPYDLWREIVEKQNKALAMVVAAMCLGISIIVAAAIH